MVASWEFDSDDDEIDEAPLMALGDSDLEEEDDVSEVSILELKENLHLFSKTKLISLMSALIDDFQESTSDRDELFNSLASIKFDFIDLEACKNIVEQENCTLKKQVEQLDSSNNDLKSEVLKLTLSEKREKAMSKDQENAELEQVRYKQECHDLTEKMNRLSQEVSKLKLDLERENRSHSNRSLSLDSLSVHARRRRRRPSVPSRPDHRSPASTAVAGFRLRRRRRSTASAPASISGSTAAADPPLPHRYDVMTTNITESLKSMLNDEWEYPVSHIFNSIARKFSEKFRERHTFIDGKNNKFMSCAKNILRDNKSTSNSFYMTNANEGIDQFTVFNNGVIAKVNLLERSCSCRKFDLVKIPCKHAMAALREKYGDGEGYDNSIYEYSSPIYKAKTYLLAYSKAINVVPPEAECTMPQKLQDTNIYPPPYDPKLGRKKVKHIKGVGETFKFKRRNKCSICKKSGRKRTTCIMANKS
ncbi:hypothetical protein BC332_00469 [Capsicum chinense]|nr:hypothetical protein BC332_00469 [Capsicum chinense]